jgi:hypothetical protein
MTQKEIIKTLRDSVRHLELQNLRLRLDIEAMIDSPTAARTIIRRYRRRRNALKEAVLAQLN